jgi:hypothetical protein
LTEEASKLLPWIRNSKKQRAFSDTLSSKDTVYYGLYLNEKTDFLLQEKRSAFLPLNRLFTNYSEIKKPELHNDRFTFAIG